MRNSIIKILSTFFYIGYLPAIPGTFASIMGAFLFYLTKDNIFVYALLILGSLFLGFWVSGEAEKIFNKKDARCIVIDEISGMLLCFIFLPYDLRLTIIVFCLFRILDALKPYPANLVQNLKGGIGVMGDDLVAAAYTNIIIQLVLRFASFKIS